MYDECAGGFRFGESDARGKNAAQGGNVRELRLEDVFHKLN